MRINEGCYECPPHTHAFTHTHTHTLKWICGCLLPSSSSHLPWRSVNLLWKDTCRCALCVRSDSIACLSFSVTFLSYITGTVTWHYAHIRCCINIPQWHSTFQKYLDSTWKLQTSTLVTRWSFDVSPWSGLWGIPGILGVRQEYTPWKGRQSIREHHTHTFTQSLTRRGNLELQIHLLCEVGEKQRIWMKPMWRQGKLVKLHTDSDLSSGSNLGVVSWQQ